MPTSIRDLAYHLQAEAALLAGRPRTSTEVRPALTYLGRAVNRLAMDGLPERSSRASASDELADACLRLAPSADLSVRATRENRPTRLAAALCDAIAIRSDQIGFEQRWAAIIEIAHTCRVLTSYSQDGVLPSDLDWVRRTARAVAAHGLSDPPVPEASRTTTWLTSMHASTCTVGYTGGLDDGVFASVTDIAFEVTTFVEPVCLYPRDLFLP